ncbi:LacI family DNA-binding transcriptional regulator [Deinococcus aquatilis]|uniref:LacI family DNA-binding transcriptional regulator n=1 Tax=Deinococcus aquatilis TaxID=519440 RepID=UPI00058BF243|nr:LacI family DNA-binding transcriptional regulator [Deinococcus aquatilis]
MTKPSVVDVARIAGVGASTVSRVLNNHPNISDQTRQRVLSAIETVGYTPNLNARSLRSGQTQAVSVLLPMTGTPFYDTLLTAIHGVLDQHGYDLALFPLLGAQRIRRFKDPGALLYRADGLLISSQNPEVLYGSRPPFNKPIVLVDAHHPQYHSVHFNNVAAGRMAAELTLSRHLPVVLLDVPVRPGDLESPVFLERRAGVLDVLQRHGITPIVTLQAPASIEGGRDAAQQLLDWAHPHPVAPFFMVALSDDLALGVQRHLLSAGLHAGRDYLLMGFDGSAAAAEAGITSVAQPVAQMGRTAADVLLGALEGQLKTITQRTFAPTLQEAPSTQALTLM